MNPDGVVFDIKRFSVNDGPGIRTAVYLKGCPLKCVWCHNPESKDAGPQVVFDERRCLGGLHQCAVSCRKGALTKTGLIGCVNLSIATIDNLNADGALHLKSARAKADFALAMVSVKGVLTTITTMLGGN